MPVEQITVQIVIEMQLNKRVIQGLLLENEELGYFFEG